MSAKLNRREVAERLGTSTTSVRRIEGVHLHPQLDADGVWRFDPREVDSVVVRRPPRTSRRKKARRATGDGAAAARVFRMLGRGRGLREIVIATGQSPAFVRQMYSEWLVALGDGERSRRRQAQEEQERRARVEAEQAHLEWMKARRLRAGTVEKP